MSTPRARAELMSVTSSGMRPQLLDPATLIWKISTGTFAFSPISMASRIESSTVSPSPRICQTHGALLHGGCDEPAHLLHFVCGRRPVLEAHDIVAHLARRHVGSDIHRTPRFQKPLEI